MLLSWFLVLGSYFLLLAPCFLLLLLASYFSLPASCFLLLTSCSLLLSRLLPSFTCSCFCSAPAPAPALLCFVLKTPGFSQAGRQIGRLVPSLILPSLALPCLVLSFVLYFLHFTSFTFTLDWAGLRSALPPEVGLRSDDTSRFVCLREKRREESRLGAGGFLF